MSNFKIVDFNSTRELGQMNTAAAFYPEEMSKEERKQAMQEHKQALVSKFGLNYQNIFIPIQKNSKNPDKYEDGLCYTLTKEDVESHEDLYDYDVNADIVKLTPETPNIAIAYPVADCAVVKAVNTKTNEIVLAHCGGEYIDRYLPMQTIDALGGSEKDIKVYVSPFAYSLFYTDENSLTWANNNEVWKGCKAIVDTGDQRSISINIYKALRRQLLERKILEENLHMSPYNIRKSDMFYSNSRGYKDPSYKGRFLSGIALIDEDKEVSESEFVKVIK